MPLPSYSACAPAIHDESGNQHPNKAGQEQSAVNGLANQEEKQPSAASGCGDQGRHKPAKAAVQRLDFSKVELLVKYGSPPQSVRDLLRRGESTAPFAADPPAPYD